MNQEYLTTLDVNRLEQDEDYFNLARKSIRSGKVKTSEEEYFAYQMAGFKWDRQYIPPSQNPAHHQNAVHQVRRVGLSKFFQDLSDFFR